MTQRIATCACRSVSITLEGDPDRTLACHCSYCKRSTGSAFRSVAWFKNEQVISIKGETKLFNNSERSKGINFNFCPNCGTTIFWTFTHNQKFTAVALGCFDDPDFPVPNFEFYTKKRMHWMPPLEDVEQFEQWPPKKYFE